MKKTLYYLIIAALCISVFNFCVSAVDIETPGEYTGESDASANANQTAVDMSEGYKKIILDVPFYAQGTYANQGDCGISSISMIEAYKKGYGSNDTTVYNAVYNYNASIVDEGVWYTAIQKPWELGYDTLVESCPPSTFLATSLSQIYEQLEHDNPVLVWRFGNGKDHFSVIYGYNGSTVRLEASGFLVLNTNALNGAFGAPTSAAYTDLETFCSVGNTMATAYYRVGNAIPLADKTGTAMFNQVWADNITAANAQIYARIPYQWITDCGFYIGTSESNMTKYAEKDNLGNGVNIEYIYYTLSDYTSLAANTKYYYKIYFVSGGTTYQSKTYCFYTGVMPNEDEEQALIAWSINEATHSVGETNAVIALTGALQGLDNTSVTEVGCYLYDANENILAQKCEDASGSMDGGASVYIWYDINSELGYMLTPNTTYRYKCFAVINGTTYYSPMQEFTTAGPSRAIIASGTCGADGDNLTWELTEEGTLTISGTGKMASPNLAPWYSHRSSITKVVIGSGVTYIGGNAFARCTNLTSITIPESVWGIGMNAFMSCETLASITLPESITYINQLAFQGCTALSSITIPANVDYILQEVFRECDNLTNIYVDSDNSNYCDVNGVLFNKNKTVLHTYPAGKNAASYVIPQSVETVGQFAFQGCASLTKVIIPKNVTTIETYGFSGCPNLTIYGYAGSTAETYAMENDIPFEALYTAVTGVTLDKSSATMDIGDILTLTATVSPSDATDTTVTWTSSDSSIAAVTNGTVTALKAGTATITVTTVDGSKTAICVVAVNEAPVADADITYTIGSASGKPGDTIEVALSVSSAVTVNGLLLDNLNYDSNALEFIEFAEYGELITTSALGANGVDSAKGEIALGYTDAVKPNGQICVITFRINDTAEDGEYTIRIDGVASVNGQKLSSEVNSGKIKVSKWVSGDFDSDEKLDMKDVVYFMNWINFSWTGKYPMVYDSDKDFNKDGNVDMKDVVYFMNWVNFSWTGNYDINW